MIGDQDSGLSPIKLTINECISETIASSISDGGGSWPVFISVWKHNWDYLIIYQNFLTSIPIMNLEEAMVNILLKYSNTEPRIVGNDFNKYKAVLVNSIKLHWSNFWELLRKVFTSKIISWEVVFNIVGWDIIIFGWKAIKNFYKEWFVS